ncbi:hypothetical protein BU23DRAFT_554782 [Bimuria novae-zelandiae CBS 107.79]|uniref:Uncharacterized protein n=1 Tax=Bimuria novae-zelandiae CBS 107.79 TaxID=1447943 RepID=A0A6A5V8C9_9PLEO|nr:hypothetical protein BU23DRAFT_554782 [Bimuria novae-zelandiae CBS 107.79]
MFSRSPKRLYARCSLQLNSALLQTRALSHRTPSAAYAAYAGASVAVLGIPGSWIRLTRMCARCAFIRC